MSIDLYYKAATSCRLPCSQVIPGQEFTVTLGAQRHLFYQNTTPFNAASVASVTGSINTTNIILKSVNIPVTPTTLISFEKKIDSQWIHDNIELPINIKPNLHLTNKNRVINPVQNPAKLLSIIADFQKKKQDCVLQLPHSATARHYSVLVFNQRILGIAQRITNEHQNINDTTSTPPYRVISIELLCKENRQLLLKTAKTLNLCLVEIELTCQHINVPYRESHGYISSTSHKPNISKYYTEEDINDNRIAKQILFSFIRQHLPGYLQSRCTKTGR